MELATLKALLQEAEEQHAKFEATAPKHDWSEWYAAYITAREEGKPIHEASADAERHLLDVLG